MHMQKRHAASLTNILCHQDWSQIILSSLLFVILALGTRYLNQVIWLRPLRKQLKQVETLRNSLQE